MEKFSVGRSDVDDENGGEGVQDVPLPCGAKCPERVDDDDDDDAENDDGVVVAVVAADAASTKCSFLSGRSGAEWTQLFVTIPRKVPVCACTSIPPLLPLCTRASD